MKKKFTITLFRDIGRTFTTRKSKWEANTMLKKKPLHFGVLATVLIMTACSSQSTAQEGTQTQSAAATAATAATNYGAITDVSIRAEAIELTEEWDKVFPLSDEVNHRKVTFVNHFGITIAADLYEPKNYKGKLPAIAVSGPFGAVKEQASGLYAQEMAKKGFLTIAFDPSYTGESSGYPRYFNSPDVNVEDFQSAVDFLSVQKNVDPEQIGIIGICGFGGHALQTAALDTRIKATAAMTMYDMSRVTALGYNDSVDEEGRYQARVNYNNQRTGDYKKGSYTLGGGLPEKAPDDAPQFLKDYIDYYKTERGYHPRSVNANGGWASTAAGSLMNMRLLEYAPEIRSDVLVVHGGDAHSLYFSQDAFKLLKGDNKELVIIPGASHTDLYDQMDVIPFDKLKTFFTDAFADES